MRARLVEPQTKRRRNIGYYASEDDAARAYDHAAVQVRGPGADCNFPHDTAAISDPPAPQRSDSHGGAAAQHAAAVKVEERPRRSFTVGRVGSGRHHAVKTEPQGGSGPHTPEGPVPAAGAHDIADAPQL
jgi:hypothetical protein